jgi:hypothetical protein
MMTDNRPYLETQQRILGDQESCYQLPAAQDTDGPSETFATGTTATNTLSLPFAARKYQYQHLLDPQYHLPLLPPLELLVCRGLECEEHPVQSGELARL